MSSEDLERTTYILRNVFPMDCIQYFHWFNDDKTRKYSNQPDVIEWSEHKQWFTNSINNPNKKMFMFIQTNPYAAVGQIRFELTDNEWWLNYSIDSSFRGKGLSKLMITQGVEKLQSDNQIVVFKAQVKPENIASNKVLTSLGWQKETDIYELRKGNLS